MLLANANKIEPYQRQLLLVFKQAADNGGTGHTIVPPGSIRFCGR